MEYVCHSYIYTSYFITCQVAIACSFAHWLLLIFSQAALPANYGVVVPSCRNRAADSSVSSVLRWVNASKKASCSSEYSLIQVATILSIYKP